MNAFASPSTWSLEAVLQRIWDRRGLFLAIWGAAILVSVVYALLTPHSYLAGAAVSLDTDAQVSGTLVGAARQLGIRIPNAGQMPSAEYYAKYLKTDDVFNRLLLARYPLRGGRTARLLEFLGKGGSTPGDSLYWGRRHLQTLYKVNVDRVTQILSMHMEARDPVLAAAVVTKALDLLQEFTLEARQTRARAKRVFLSRRLAEVGDSLQAAENALRMFYEKNRTWGSSPTLLLEESRLQRRIDFAQQVFTQLTMDYEAARIDEVNNVPAITLVDKPDVPAHKHRPRRLMIGILGLIFGFALATIGTAYVPWLLSSLKTLGPQFHSP